MKTINGENNINEPKNESKNWPQIVAILIACLAPFTCGIFFSWTSPFLIKITQDKSIYDISEEEASYFTVIPPIAMVLATLCLSTLNDKIGRRLTILITSIPYVIGWTLIATATNVWMFYLSRAFTGIGDGLMFSSIPMYIGEISSPKVRGVWGNALTFALYFGQFVITVIGSYLDVRQTAYICICIPILAFILFWFMPESPYFFIMKGEHEKAKMSLRQLTRKVEVKEEFLILKADVERQMSESGTWKDLFVGKSNRRALYAGVFLRTSQQLGGISCFAVYTQFIFQKSGGNMSPEISSIIFLGTNCILNAVSAYTLEIIGKRLAYIISLLACGLILLIESIYFFIEQYETQIEVGFLNWIPITGMMLFVVFFSIGTGIVPTLMLGELFSTSIKAKGLSVLILVFGFWISVTTKLFYFLTTNFGLFSPFLLFSISCFLSTILALYLIPDTKGKTLEEIQQSLKGFKTKKEVQNVPRS